MADSKSYPSSNSPPGKNVKAPNVFERAKEEFEAVVHNGKHRHEHHKETHGMREDIDSNTPSSGVKAPNVFERAKEEFEAVLHSGKHRNEHHKESHGMGEDIDCNTPSSDVKAPNVFERAKEEFEAVLHSGKHRHEHHKETHGMREDIDCNTPSSDVKAPNVFERAKEEIEAIVEAIHPKKDPKSHDSHAYGETRNTPTKSSVKSEKSEMHPEWKEKAAGNESEKHHRRSDDIEDVRGPNVFERAKEEIEALIETIHPKKDSGRPN